MPDVDLPVAGMAKVMRCGDMWGTQCRAIVRGPLYRHSGHPGDMKAISVLRHDKLPPEVLRAWAVQRGSDVVHNPHTPGDVLEMLYVEDKASKSLIALHKNSPIELLRLIARSADKDLATGLLGNPALPEEEIGPLLERHQYHRYLVSALLTRTDLPEHLISVYLEHARQIPYDTSIQSLVNSRYITDDQLRILASAGRSVLEVVLRSPKCPPDIIDNAIKVGAISWTAPLPPNAGPDAVQSLYELSRRWGINSAIPRILDYPHCPRGVLGDILVRYPRYKETVLAHPMCDDRLKAIYVLGL